VAKFNYLGTTVTDQNSICEEMKKEQNKYGNVCYYSDQNLLSFHLLSRNLEIKIYTTIILPAVLYGCET
jgi:hypothetical protein